VRRTLGLPTRRRIQRRRESTKAPVGFSPNTTTGFLCGLNLKVWYVGCFWHVTSSAVPVIVPGQRLPPISRVDPVKYMTAPARPSSSAIPFPISRVAPVTTATLPFGLSHVLLTMALPRSFIVSSARLQVRGIVQLVSRMRRFPKIPLRIVGWNR